MECFKFTKNNLYLPGGPRWHQQHPEGLVGEPGEDLQPNRRVRWSRQNRTSSEPRERGDLQAHLRDHRYLFQASFKVFYFSAFFLIFLERSGMNNV